MGRGWQRLIEKKIGSSNFSCRDSVFSGYSENHPSTYVCDRWLISIIEINYYDQLLMSIININCYESIGMINIINIDYGPYATQGIDGKEGKKKKK